MATVVANDPAFGDYAYGGVLTRAGNSVRVIARDGLRMRLHVIRNKQRLHLLFDNDGFAAEQPVTISDDLSNLAFRVENRAKRSHDTQMRISGMPSGNYAIAVNGARVVTFSGSDQEQILHIPLGSGADAAMSITRR
jgi:isopentenyl phosphate kinase